MGCASCMCCILTWIASIIANGAVFALLGLCILYWQNWPSALGLSVTYLIVLLCITGRYHSKEIAKHSNSNSKAAAAAAAAAAEEEENNWADNTTADGVGRSSSGGANGESNEPNPSSTPAGAATASSVDDVRPNGTGANAALALARRLRRRRQRNAAHQKIPIPAGLSMMYLITNIMLAVPSAIVVFFTFPCSDPDIDTRRQVYWKTNVTALPPNVQTWMGSVKVGEKGSTFAQTSTDTYVFGSFLDQEPQLYAIEEVGVTPTPLGYSGNVHDVTAVTSTDICFVSSYAMNRESSIMCGNVQSGFREQQMARDRYSFALAGIDGLLWFLQINHEYYVFDPLRGGSCTYNQLVFCHDCAFPACRVETMKVLSMNSTTMEIVNHSRKYATRHKNRRTRYLKESENTDDEAEEDYADKEGYYQEDDDATTLDEETEEDVQEQEEAEEAEGDETDDEEFTEIDEGIFCDGHMMTRLRALGSFVVSALPILFNSGRIWVKYAIPSASVTLFLSIGYGLYFVFGFLNPVSAQTGFGLWMYFGTPVWTLVCTYQLVVNPRVTKAPLWWSVYGITTGLIAAVAYEDYRNEVKAVRAFDAGELENWIVDAALVHFPLLMIAILTKSVYVSFLTLIGFLLLTTIMIWNLTDNMNDTYLYGGISYGCVLLVALIVYCMRGFLHRKFFGWLSACARHTCAIEVADDDDEEYEENTAGLLLNENAEDA